MPLHNPGSLLACIAEGENPFGTIPEHAELCIKNTEMLQRREDKPITEWPPEQKASSKSQADRQSHAPRPTSMAVKIGSSFGNRRNIISLQTMKLQIIEMLTARPEEEKEEPKRPQFRRIVEQPPEDLMTDNGKQAAKETSLAEAQERLYMQISNRRVPHFRHHEITAEHRLRHQTDPNPFDQYGNDAGSPGTGI
jgi:hypothetical protein